MFIYLSANCIYTFFYLHLVKFFPWPWLHILKDLIQKGCNVTLIPALGLKFLGSTLLKGFNVSELLCDINNSTQPISDLKTFNNWDFVPKGWYIACKIKDLKTKKPISKKICGHQVVLFRTESGKAVGLDAFCPHMGLNLAKKGKVIGEDIRCFFHYWKFDSKGKCTHIPCINGMVKENTKDRVKTQSYPIEEKYGYVWIFSDTEATHPVFEIPELEGKEIMFTHLDPFNRVAHPHITMMNSIDEQHMRTVHKLAVSLNVTQWEKGTRFFTGFEGPVLTDTWFGKLHKFFLGDRYSSSVLFEDGNLGLLTTGINVKLFNRWSLAKGYFIFSHTFTERGKNQVWPIIITPRRKGVIGFLFSWTYLRVNKLCMKFLAHQDGKVIYGNLRFRQDGLLPGVDGPTAKWISFLNRAIEPSKWSKKLPKEEINKNFSKIRSSSSTEEEGRGSVSQ